MAKGLQYFFLFILVGLPLAKLSASTNNISRKDHLELAQKLCEVDCDIHKIDRDITKYKANGGPSSDFADLRIERNVLIDKSDSLEVLFQTGIHHNRNDFFYESRDCAWFLVIQYFLDQRGIRLSANDRYDYVNALPQKGGFRLGFKTNVRDTNIVSTYIDSAIACIFNQHYPTWKKCTYNTIQKLTIGIDVFIKISRNHFIPFTAQTEAMNCGPTCLKMVLEQFGAYHSLEELAELSSLDETGTSFNDLTAAAEQLHVNTENYKMSYEELMSQMDMPVIVHWENRHFVVVYAMSKEIAWVADPDQGRIEYSREDFCKKWLYGTEKTSGEGSVLILSPMTSFYH